MVWVKTLINLLPECVGELTLSHCSSPVYTYRCVRVFTYSMSVIMTVALSSMPGMVLTTLQSFSHLIFSLSHLILITWEVDTHFADREPEIKR